MASPCTCISSNQQNEKPESPDKIPLSPTLNTAKKLSALSLLTVQENGSNLHAILTLRCNNPSGGSREIAMSRTHLRSSETGGMSGPGVPSFIH